MALRGVLQQLGFWTTVFKWKEPMLYRVRLRRDLIPPSIMAFSIGALATAVLLVLFAIYVNPPNALFALVASWRGRTSRIQTAFATNMTAQ